MTSTTETCDSIESTMRQKYCSINPKKELNFLSVKNMYTARLTISNPSCKKSMMYKVRITASGQYSVMPSAGLVHPKASKVIQIIFRSKTEIKDRYHDMFLIQALPYSGDEYVDEPQHIVNEFIKATDQGGLDAQSLKLKVHFEIAKESTPSNLKLRSQSSSNSKKLTFFQEMGSPARIHGLKGSSPTINNIYTAKKSQRDYNFTTEITDKPIIMPEKMMSSQFRQSIVRRFAYGEKSLEEPLPLMEMVKRQHSDSILETKFATEWSPTKSSQFSTSSGQRMKIGFKKVYEKDFL